MDNDVAIALIGGVTMLLSIGIVAIGVAAGNAAADEVWRKPEAKTAPPVLSSASEAIRARQGLVR